MKPANNEHVIVNAVKDGTFEIDTSGRVWRLKNCRVKNGGIFKDYRKRAEKLLPNGYLQIRLSVKGKRYHIYAHRLVYTCLVGEIPNGLSIDHINGNKTDNHPDNLEPVTSGENRRRAQKLTHCWSGEKNGMARLTKTDVLTIRALHDNGTKSHNIANGFGVSTGHVNDIIARRMWKHVL